MSTKPEIEVNGVTIRIPMKLRYRGDRKLVIVPVGLVGDEDRPAFDDVVINALVRAHGRRRQIDSGSFGRPRNWPPTRRLPLARLRRCSP